MTRSEQLASWARAKDVTDLVTIVERSRKDAWNCALRRAAHIAEMCRDKGRADAPKLIRNLIDRCD